MGIFNKSVKISKPGPQIATTGDVNFPGSTIWVRSAVITETGGQYVPTVMQHLSEIHSFPFGIAFFAALSQPGKRQVIKYGGQNVNQAAGGGISSYRKLRQHHDMMDKTQFASELQTTLLSSGHNKNWLAEQLHRTDLPLWSGGTTASPFKSIARPALAAALPGKPRPQPLNPHQVNELEIDQWLAGTKLPSRDEMDVLCLVLEPWLDRGVGTSSLISYDPHKVAVGGASRPPHVALVHELVHAYYNAIGGQLGREDSINENNGGRLFELMAVGLGPFAAWPYSENKFRTAIAFGLRAQYP